MNYRIISIGTLSKNDLWPKDTPPRTAHATTTLISTEDRNILVDPSLPPQIIEARLTERSGLTAGDITDVFLTNFRPAHRRGLQAFEHANWLISEAEREHVGRYLVEQFQAAGDADIKQMLEQEIALLKRCNIASDKITEHVDLFPLSGFTPGTCGLLLLQPRSTILIASDAIATVEHLEHGKILRESFDIKQAQESLLEAVEIADVIIPGHDNIIVNPTKQQM